MTFVRSFEDYYPPKRFDGVPFSEAVIEESTEEGGSYTAIAALPLAPVDADPAEPASRDLTTTAATVDPGWYRIVWKDASGAAYKSAPIYYSSPATTYATTAALREKLQVSSAQLPEPEAASLIHEAEDLVDERLGVWPILAATGRKIDTSGDGQAEAWQIQKLAEATVEVAAVIFEDPGVTRRQRARFVSGDITINGPYGPAFGERGAALLRQSELQRLTDRTRGGQSRRCRTHGYRPPA